MRISIAFNLCPKLCFIQQNNNSCIGSGEYCLGACCGNESPEIYNTRVLEALTYIKRSSSTYLLIDEGRTITEKSCILIENGKFYGMGYFAGEKEILSIDEVKSLLVPYHSNEYIENLVYNYTVQYPHKQVLINS
jgi:DNA polymerase-3 subunit epsilon